MTATSLRFLRATLGLGLALATVGIWVAPQASALPSTLYSNLNDGAWKSTNNVYLAQSFVTTATGGSLNSIQVWVRGANESNGFGAPSTFTAYLYSSASGTPSTQLATLGTKSVGAWSDEQYLISPPTSVSLASNTEYFIVIAGASFGTAGWKFTSTAPTTYTSGTPVSYTSSNSGSTWTSLSSTNFSMAVISNPPAALPTLGALAAVNATFGDSTITITDPTSNAAGTWGYSSSNNAIASVSGNVLTINGAGVAILTASFSPTDSTAYLPDSTTSQITIAMADVTLGSASNFQIASSSWPYLATIPLVTASVSGSWSHSANNNAAISGDSVSLPGSGSYLVTSTFHPTDSTNFNSATVQRTITALAIVVPTPTPSTSKKASPSPTPSVSLSEKPTTAPTPEPSQEFVSTPTPTPSPSATELSGNTTQLLAGDIFEQPPAPIDVDINATAGTLIENSTIEISGSGLLPGSSVSATVYSTPTNIYSGMTSSSGEIQATVNLPSGLESSSTHSVVIKATRADSESVTVAGAIIVDNQGLVAGVAPASPIAGFDQAAAVSLARAAQVGIANYDPRVNAVTTTGIAVAATSLLALAGAGGLAGAAGSGAGSSTSASARGTRKNSQGKLASMVTKKLKAVGTEDLGGLGDIHLTARPPLSAQFDDVMKRGALRAGIASSVLPRVFVDGSWFRVIAGSASMILWFAAAALSAWDALTHPEALAKPSNHILYALIIMSFIDAMAGLWAFLMIAGISIAQGEIILAADVRLLLGLAMLLISLPLLVHAIRPLRRMWRIDSAAKLERAFDYIMPPIFVAFAAGSMLKALNGLSGLKMVTPEDISYIRSAGFIGVLIRMLGEDLAFGLFPKRSLQVQPEKLKSPNRKVSAAAIGTRSLLFLFIAAPFFGVSSTSLIAAALLALPLALKLWEDQLPDLKFIHKWLPRGLLRFTSTMILGIYLSRYLMGEEPTDELVKSTYIWLLLPSTLIGVLELLGRSGGDWNNRWIKWLSGAALWGFTIGITLGKIQL
ncbi:MAG: hypothetical protein F2839_02655 [Actinobacteria bacterium]|uniref:Unannotated protein n=1 Tax=freshwater metagenome TaxID=449393 RepID=A0A6J5Z621_9ZZZZ|nr:hypothetical protein [Actinomycetota bacterium]